MKGEMLEFHFEGEQNHFLGWGKNVLFKSLGKGGICTWEERTLLQLSPLSRSDSWLRKVTEPLEELAE